MMTKNTFHAMIVPIIAPTCRYIARPANTCDSPHATSGEEHDHHQAERALAVEAQRACTAGRRTSSRRRATRPLIAIACHGAMSATLRSIMYRSRVRVVHDDEQREPRHPRPVRLPLEPVQRLGKRRRRDAELLRVIEAAAVDRPQLAAHACVGVLLALRRQQAVVEQDEVERRADPGDAGDEVDPADQELQPVAGVGFHRTLASCRDRSSSSRARRAAGRDSAQPRPRCRSRSRPRRRTADRGARRPAPRSIRRPRTPAGSGRRRSAAPSSSGSSQRPSRLVTASRISA